MMYFTIANSLLFISADSTAIKKSTDLSGWERHEKLRKMIYIYAIDGIFIGFPCITDY